MSKRSREKQSQRDPNHKQNWKNLFADAIKSGCKTIRIQWHGPQVDDIEIDTNTIKAVITWPKLNGNIIGEDCNLREAEDVSLVFDKSTKQWTYYAYNPFTDNKRTGNREWLCWEYEFPANLQAAMEQVERVA